MDCSIVYVFEGGRGAGSRECRSSSVSSVSASGSAAAEASSRRVLADFQGVVGNCKSDWDGEVGLGWILGLRRERSSSIVGGGGGILRCVGGGPGVDVRRS